MKLFFVFLLSLFVLPAFGQFMSNEEILKEFNKKEVKESVFVPNAQYLENMKKLIPADQFKPKTEAVEWYDQESSIKDNPILDSVDLRVRDTSVKSQGSTSLCTAFSLVAIMENLINKNGMKAGLDLSEQHAFNFYNVYQMDAAIKAISANKICDDEFLRLNGTANAKCTANAHAKVVSFRQIAQSEVTQSLSNGYPVYFGVSVPRGMSSCQKTITDEVVTSGGHALEIVGYNKASLPYYTIKNSWGSSCGDKGYQYLRADYCKTTWCYFYEVTGVSSKYDLTPTPVPTTIPTVMPTVTPKPINPVCVKYKWVFWPFKKKCVIWE